MKSIKILISLILTLSLIVSCRNSMLELNSPVSTGALLVTAQISGNERTILPDDSAITHYSITGVGPNNSESLPQIDDSTTASFTVTGLTVGDWSITVQGKDENENIVASGSTVVSITVGLNANAIIQLLPVVGSGTLSLSVSWPASKEIDEVNGVLTSVEGVSLPITLLVSRNSASYSSNSVSSGSYTLTITCKKGGIALIAPRMECVVVYTGKIASGIFSLTDEDFDEAKSAKIVSGFNIVTPAVTGIINQTDHTISLTVPYGTDISSLVPSIVFSGASISPLSSVAQDFENPVNYTVTALDGTYQSYEVIVNVTPATVTFDSYSSTTAAVPASKAVSYPANTVITLPQAPLKNGYSFGGWYTEPEGAGTVFDADTIITGNLTVYAKWNSYSYTVLFDQQGATLDSSPTSIQVNTPDMTVQTLPVAPEKTGYNFKGWFTQQNGAGSRFDASSNVTGNTTVYAYWVLPLPASTNVVATFSGFTSHKLQWDAVPGAAWYIIEQDISGWLDTGIVAYTNQYFYNRGHGVTTDYAISLRIVPVEADGTRGTPSDPVACTFKGTNSLNFREVSATSNSISFSWDTPISGCSYCLWVDGVPFPNYGFVTFQNGSSIIITGLTANTVYKIRLGVIDPGASESNISSTDGFATFSTNP